MFPYWLNQGLELSDYSLGQQSKNKFQFSQWLYYQTGIWDGIEMCEDFLVCDCERVKSVAFSGQGTVLASGP